jgi:23S rRNA pseudouridine2457 synthase
VLSQFTSADGHLGLEEFNLPKDVYPIGRLDYDSEGLLLLTDDGALQHRLSHPKFNKPKIYWAQIEHIPSPESLSLFAQGLVIQKEKTKPAKIKVLDPQPTLPERSPPIRVRASIPDVWVEIELREGRNRQIRRMTAAIGHPTLRLLRVQMLEYNLFELDLEPGQWCELAH